MWNAIVIDCQGWFTHSFMYSDISFQQTLISLLCPRCCVKCEENAVVKGRDYVYYGCKLNFFSGGGTFSGSQLFLEV